MSTRLTKWYSGLTWILQRLITSSDQNLREIAPFDFHKNLLEYQMVLDVI